MLKAAALSLLAAAALAGCASRGPQPVSSAGATAPTDARIVPQAMPYRPGTGVVQSVSRSSDAREPLSVLAIRMDDGGMQYVDTASDVRAGSRVQLTPDHKILMQ